MERLALLLLFALAGCADPDLAEQARETRLLRQEVARLVQQSTEMRQRLGELERRHQRPGNRRLPVTALDGGMSFPLADGNVDLAVQALGNLAPPKEDKDKWVTRIPTHLNDGTPVPAEKLTLIVRRVADEFGGASLDGPGRGIWVGPDGTVYDESSFTLSVACAAENMQRARDIVLWIGRELEQKTMYFEILDSPVQIIPVE